MAASPSPEPARAGDAPVGREVAGRYRIVEKLGEGGMGAVFRAEQIALSRTVALKVLRAELSADPGLVRRFHAEARLAARLNHPNTVTLFDFGQDDDGSLFIAMEYVEGHSLREELVASGALPPVRALRIAEQVCASLADAHAHGIVHRDLKPDNVMLTQRGSKTDIVRVLDFGIAKLRDERNDGTSIPMTQQGDLIGTPQYMAPEQIRGEQVDTYTDVYALGAMLYEMVTGRLPFEGKTVLAILSKHITEDPVPPSQRRRDLGVPPAVDALVLDCMRKEPRERPADMEALGERIARLRAQLAEADPRAALPQRRYRSRPPGVPMTPPDPRPPVARPAAAAGFEPTVWNPTPAGAAAGPAAGARGSAPAPAG
ncbi:MAG: serine/threonine protein kinase, partial [Deltaproteobacteria bacterium]